MSYLESQYGLAINQGEAGRRNWSRCVCVSVCSWFQDTLHLRSYQTPRGRCGVVHWM